MKEVTRSLKLISSVVLTMVLGAYAQLSAKSTGGPAYPPLAALPALEQPNPKEAELGKLLFFDRVISGNADRRCADCHIPEKGWADGMALSDGYPGTKHYRNSKTVLNAVYSKYFYWDGRLDGKDMPTQVRDIITDSHFHAADGRIMAQRLKQIPGYDKRFRAVYGKEPSFGRMIKAVAAFEKTLVPKNVPFDAHIKGDKAALSAKAKQGLKLFKGKAGCIQCHNGFIFSDFEAYNLGVPENPAIFSEVKRHITLRSQQMFLGTPNYFNLRQDPGFFAVTKDYDDFGAFVTPSLREVSRTAPYMHNGMLSTLADVIDFYNRGGGVAANKSDKLKPLGLSGKEKGALVAFLESLSGDPILMGYTEDDLPKYELIEDWYSKDN